MTAERDSHGPPRVVIAGGGYAGVYAALELQQAARRSLVRLSLVSRDNFFLSQPMLAEVVSGSIEPPHILASIRRMVPAADLYKAEIEAIDVEDRNIVIRYSGHGEYRDVPYDHLIVAVGTGTDLSAVPGVAEHAFPFKTMGDAFLLRNHLIGGLEAAEVEDDPALKLEPLTIVVVGGGYTGVEVAAEINDFTREAAKSYRRVDPRDVRVVLVQGGDRILPELAPSLADFSHRLLEKRGIGIRLGTRIAGATANAVMLTDGTTIRARTLVAAIGSAPNRLLDTIPAPRDTRGRIEVDVTLAVVDVPHLWAVGDCAAIPDLRRGGTCPPTAQYALREGRTVARNVLATIRGDEPRPFTHRNLGVFVPLGRFSAAAEVLGLKLSGFLAWWLYRTYYLWQLPRLDRKLRVLFDWTLELIFRRGIVQMDVGSSEAITRGHYEPGDVVFRQGEIAGSFYVITGGKIQIYREESGQESELATLGPGEYFGEMSLLEGVTHTASARAQSPVDLLIMGGAEFKALAGSSTHFGELLAQVMRQRERANVTEGDSAGLEQRESE